MGQCDAGGQEALAQLKLNEFPDLGQDLALFFGGIVGAQCSVEEDQEMHRDARDIDDAIKLKDGTLGDRGKCTYKLGDFFIRIGSSPGNPVSRTDEVELTGFGLADEELAVMVSGEVGFRCSVKTRRPASGLAGARLVQ